MHNTLVSLYLWSGVLGGRLRGDHKALESLEWAVIAAAVVVVAVGGYGSVLGGVDAFFGKIAGALANVSVHLG